MTVLRTYYIMLNNCTHVRVAHKGGPFFMP